MTNELIITLPELELQRMIKHTNQIKSIIMSNLTKLIETEQIENISKYSELYSILKPFDTVLTDSLESVVQKTIKNNPETITENQGGTKRAVGRPKGKTIVIAKNKEKNERKKSITSPKETIIVSDTKKKTVGRPRVRTTLKPLNSKMKEYTIDYDFTSTKPVSYTLNGEKFQVKSWKRLFEDVVTQIIDENSENIDKLLSSPLLKGNKIEYVSTKETDMRSPLSIDVDGEEIFVETYGSSNVLMELLKRILNGLELDKNSVTIELKK